MDPHNDSFTKGYDVSFIWGCKRAWHAFILDLIKQTLEQFTKVLLEYLTNKNGKEKMCDEVMLPVLLWNTILWKCHFFVLTIF